MDWYSVDATAPLAVPGSLSEAQEVLAMRLSYPGSPNPRWWEIEDAHVDIGGYPPDRSHFATMLLIDLIVSHSDDWFTFPVQAESGSIVTLHDVTVRDSFGDEWKVHPPTDWRMFHVEGLADTSLVVWPTVTTPLGGPPLEDVTLGIDEDANLLFAVERRLRGRDVGTSGKDSGGDAPDTSGQVDASARKSYRYLPTTNVKPNWHPYVIQEVNGKRQFVQGRLADLAPSPAEPIDPEATAEVLKDESRQPGDPMHQIKPSTIPPLGMHLERRAMLARRTDGRPVLWIQRRRMPLLSPPGLNLRFDAVKEIPAVRQA